MRFIKLLDRKGNLLKILDLDNFYVKILFEKMYPLLEKIDVDTYKFKG